MITQPLTPFPCNSCGKCCSNVHLSDMTKYLDKGDGTCRNLDETTNLCLIYDDRPDICRVELQYRKNYETLYSWDDFVTLNLKVCESLPSRVSPVE